MWERRAAHPMLDVRLFRNMRFSAASGAVTVSFFTLFGFIFLITQYFQFVRGYGPLSTGVRLLPVAVSVGAGSVAGTQLAVRAGTKLIVTTGLVAMAGFYGWVAAIAHQSVGAAYVAAGQLAALGHPALGLALQHASTNAFLRGLVIGALVVGSVAAVGAVGAVLAVLFLPAQPATPTAYQAETAERAHGSQTNTHPPTTATSPRPEIGRPDI